MNHGILAKAIGGWQLNGILTLMTGTPVTFGANGTALNTPGSNQTADQVAEVTKLYGINTPAKGGSAWFSQSSFVQPTGVRFGTSGRNNLSGPTSSTQTLHCSRFSTSRRGGRWNCAARRSV
jgi:hypothetical protein